jgi:hypothetical protein
MRRHLASLLALALAVGVGGCSGCDEKPSPPPPPPVLCPERACTGGTLCISGACQPACGSLLTRCGTGDTAVCVDLASDAAHCGECTAACASGLVCEARTCVTPCPAGQARCDGACVPKAIRTAGLGLPGVRASLTSASPVAFLVVDVDGDSIPDLVVAEARSATAGRIEILRGAGDGTFSPYSVPSIVSFPFAPSSLVAGDVDGDGRVDLAVGTADPTVTSVTLLSGDGAGGFAEAGLPVPDAGAGPRAVALADVDGDLDLDLVVGDGAAEAASNLRVFLNDGLGTFGLPPAVPGGVRPPHHAYTVLPDVRQVVVGPLDLDANPDLLVVSAGTTDAGGEVMLGAGGGAFTQSTSTAFPLPGVPTATVAAFLSGSTTLDWAVAIGAANLLRIFVNDGTGVTTPQTSQDVTNVVEPLGLAAEDLDGDGRVDLLSANAGDGASYFHRNLGPDLGGIALAAPVSIPAGVRPSAVALMSVPAVGSWVLTASGDGLNVAAARVTPSGFVVPRLYPVNVSADAVALGRFDGDPWLDFAAASVGADEVRVFHQSTPNPPSADFSSWVSLPLPSGAAPAALAAGDLDADGADDLAVAMKGLAQVGLLYGDGNGAFSPPFALDVGVAPSALLLAQLDDHAGLDLATADAGSDRVTVLLSTGQRTWAAPVVLAAGPAPVALAAVDLDLRGCVDLVSANSGDGTLSVFRCVPGAPGTFQPAASVPACAGARALAVTPVDADVLPDLVVGCAAGLFALQNLGGGTFGPPTALSDRPDPAAIQVADLDGDGVKDLVIASRSDGGVALLRGRPGGGFSAPEVFTVGGSAVGIAVAAIDADAQLDVVAAVTRPSAAFLGAGAAFLRGTCSP